MFTLRPAISVTVRACTVMAMHHSPIIHTNFIILSIIF
jgi:hypothetical protein